MPFVETYIDVCDFNDTDIAEEFLRRLKTINKSKFKKEKIEKIKSELKDIIKIIQIGNFEDIEITTLDDEMKLDHFKKVFNKYSVTQIENMLP